MGLTPVPVDIDENVLPERSSCDIPILEGMYMNDETAAPRLRAELDAAKEEIARVRAEAKSEVEKLRAQFQFEMNRLEREVRNNHDAQNVKRSEVERDVAQQGKVLVDLVGIDGTRGRVGGLEADVRRLFGKYGDLREKYIKIAFIIVGTFGGGAGIGAGVAKLLGLL